MCEKCLIYIHDDEELEFHIKDLEITNIENEKKVIYFCKEHKKELNILCLDCKTIICEDCVFKNKKHNNHIKEKLDSEETISKLIEINKISFKNNLIDKMNNFSSKVELNNLKIIENEKKIEEIKILNKKLNDENNEIMFEFQKIQNYENILIEKPILFSLIFDNLININNEVKEINNDEININNEVKVIKINNEINFYEIYKFNISCGGNHTIALSSNYLF